MSDPCLTSLNALIIIVCKFDGLYACLDQQQNVRRLLLFKICYLEKKKSRFFEIFCHFEGTFAIGKGRQEKIHKILILHDINESTAFNSDG